MTGRRVVVVGASSGIGRAFAVHAARAGADVVMTARRKDRLDEAIAEAGGGTPVQSDMSSPEDCARSAHEIHRTAPVIDVLMYAAAVAPIDHIEDTSPEAWLHTLATNVVGFTQLMSVLLPALSDEAVVAVMGTEVVQHARYGLGAYGASKAALDSTLRSWRLEHPTIRFMNLAIGPTHGTELSAHADPALLARAWHAWGLQGLNQKELMENDALGQAIVNIVAAALAVPGVCIEDATLRAPSGAFDRGDLP
jgi:NAD(P)-dependent dehydrogenase (short-subunit alcohol dehydrogenase family)